MKLQPAIEKGHYGYVDRRQKNQLIKAILCGLVVAFFIILGLIIFKTKMNILMVPGMFMVMPFANFLVSWLAIAKYSSATPEMYEVVRAYDEAGMLLSDLVFVDDKGMRYFCEFTVIYKNGILIYASDKKWDTYKVEVHLNDQMKKRGIPMKCKVYKNWDEYIERINGVEPAVDENETRRVELARETVINTCI